MSATEIRTLTFLLASYYIIAVGANAPDLKEIKTKIEVEIEVEKIKNNIIQQLRNNRAQIDQPRLGNMNAPGGFRGDADVTSSRIITDANVIPTNEPVDKNSRSPGGVMSKLVVDTKAFPTGTPQETPDKSKPLIVIGEPRNKSSKDKCLNFKFGNYMKTQTIVPIRMNLWIYLRVVKNRKKKNKGIQANGKDAKKSGKLGSDLKAPKSQRDKRQTKKRNKNKKRRHKKRRNRKNKKGRKVKIFVSDEKKRLVIMRMRVKKTNWYMLELPISQFPSLISLNYTRTLCIKCKRCNKKIEIDIRSKRLLGNPTVPFIHIEPLQSLPHSIYRHNTRRRRHVVRQQDLERVPSPCCRQDIHTEYIAKDFPNVLHPLSINISVCKHLSPAAKSRDSNIPLLSHQNTSISNQVSWSPNSGLHCEVESLEPLVLTFIDSMLNIKQVTIDSILPTGCRCKYSHG